LLFPRSRRAAVQLAANEGPPATATAPFFFFGPHLAFDLRFPRLADVRHTRKVFFAGLAFLLLSRLERAGSRAGQSLLLVRIDLRLVLLLQVLRNLVQRRAASLLD